GDLEVVRKDEVVYRSKCRATGSPFTMAVVHDDYAALTADHMLVASRRGHTIEIPTSIRAEYELAMASDGVIAIAEYSPTGTVWFVRPDDKLLEPGPAHQTQPFSLAADGDLAAWGYVDGTVIVLDTVTGTVWPLRGHSGKVSHIVVDA